MWLSRSGEAPKDLVAQATRGGPKPVAHPGPRAVLLSCRGRGAQAQRRAHASTQSLYATGGLAGHSARQALSDPPGHPGGTGGAGGGGGGGGPGGGGGGGTGPAGPGAYSAQSALKLAPKPPGAMESAAIAVTMVEVHACVRGAW